MRPICSPPLNRLLKASLLLLKNWRLPPFLLHPNRRQVSLRKNIRFPDQKVLETDLIQFISFFGTEGTATASELDSQDVLFFCLVEAFRQKDMLGYYFEQNDSGEYLIPSSIVAQQAKNLFGLDGFAPTDSTRYDADNDAYRYSVGHDAGSYNYALADPKGTPDGGIAYEIDFFAPEDLNFEQPPLYTLRLSFSMARINGMPYLQFISKETI